jgi:1-deoxy-D-xylulose-5-phosphate reductoisomerase
VTLAGTVLTKKGTYGAVLNRSNEVAVAHFLKGDISFLDIERIVIKCMNEHKNISHPSLTQIIEVDHKINEKAELLVKQIMKGEQI